MQPPRPTQSRWPSWLFATGTAGAFFLALSGVVVRHRTLVPPGRVYLCALVLFAIWAFLALYGDRLAKYGYLSSLSTPIFLSLVSQWTGGWVSPLNGFLFPMVALAAWFQGLRHALASSALFILLAFASEREDLPSGPYVAAALCALAFFLLLLRKVAEIRRQKERFQGRLERIQEEAKQLAAKAEPASFRSDAGREILNERIQGARYSAVVGLEGTLQRDLEIIRRSLGVHTAACFLLAQMGDQVVLRARAVSSESKDFLPDTVIPLGESLVGLAAKERRKVLVDPLASESAGTLPYYARPQDVRAFLALPIALPQEEGAEPEWMGVLVLDHRSPGAFEEARVELASAFGRRLGETLQSARVLHFSGSKTRNLDALYGASQAFSTLLDEEQVVRTTLSTAEAMFEAESSFVALLSSDGSSLVVKAGHGRHREGVTLEGLDAELARCVLINRAPIRYSKGMRGEVAGLFQGRGGALSGIHSCLMVPLRAGDRTLGVIRLDSRQSDAYQEFDQEVLQTLANQAGLALENARRVRQVEELAVRDGLTGLFNHRYFQERLGEELTKSERYHKDLCLVLMDVDHFKKFNDQYGHPEGDRVLKAVAGALAQAVRRKVDVVARYGGEEFVVILPETAIQAGKELAERIRAKVESLMIQRADGNGIYHVTLSLGVSAYPFDAREQGALIQAADEALYASKASGRNKVTTASENKAKRQ